MTADHVTIAQPKHPIYVLTTGELTAYRRQLETAIAADA